MKHEIEINDKIFKVRLLKSEEEQEKGLQNVKDLPEDEGALFILDEPTDCSIWMKDTYIPLMILFIDENEEIIKVANGEPLNEEGIECEGVKYIIEINPTDGIKVGDEVDLNLEDVEDLEDKPKKIKEYVVLGENGEIAMTFKGCVKIFSRKHTKSLIKYAKKANDLKTDKAYEALGAKLFKFLKTQSENNQETVEVK